MNDGIGVAGAAAVLKKVGHVIVVVDPHVPKYVHAGFSAATSGRGGAERGVSVCVGGGGGVWRGAFALDVTENGVIMRGVHMTKE